MSKPSIASKSIHLGTQLRRFNKIGKEACCLRLNPLWAFLMGFNTPQPTLPFIPLHSTWPQYAHTPPKPPTTRAWWFHQTMRGVKGADIPFSHQPPSFPSTMINWTYNSTTPFPPHDKTGEDWRTKLVEGREKTCSQNTTPPNTSHIELNTYPPTSYPHAHVHLQFTPTNPSPTFILTTTYWLLIYLRFSPPPILSVESGPIGYPNLMTGEEGGMEPVQRLHTGGQQKSPVHFPHRAPIIPSSNPHTHTQKSPTKNNATQPTSHPYTSPHPNHHHHTRCVHTCTYTLTHTHTISNDASVIFLSAAYCSSHWSHSFIILHFLNKKSYSKRGVCWQSVL